MNPFDLTGPQFLVLYVVLLVVTVGVALALRQRARRWAGSAPTQRELDPYEVAYLSSGAQQMALTAVDGLSQGRGLVVGRNRKLECGGTPSAWHPVEHAALQEVQRRGSIAPGRLAHALSARPEVQQVALRLQAEGLVLPPSARAAARTAALVYLPLLALGTARAIRGVALERPIGFLVLLLLLTVGLAAVTLVSPRLSRAGDAALAELRRRHAALKTAASTGRTLLAPQDAALAVGLFGVVAVTNPLVRTAFTPSYSGGGDGGGGDGGSSCGGGGCGGGGCGG